MRTVFSARARLGVAAATVLSAAFGCATNPVTGQRELMLLGEGQEVQLGAEADESIVAQYGVVDRPELDTYMNGLGRRLVGVSHRPNLAFTFRLLDDPVVNAFALPGGYVYITRGILAYLNSEAAMAGVMGHEVGHVTARHGAQRYTQQQLLGLGLGVGSIISEDFAKVAGVAAGAAQLLFLKFGRDDERQADRLGVEYATKIGYDTRDMANFFRTLDALSGDTRLPAWQSTHPDPGERYETVKTLTTQWQAEVPQSSFAWKRDEYLRMLDGLAFGPNPRNGFVEGGMFKHPDLAFQFPVPDGWRVLNGQTQVQIGEPNGAAAILFALAEGASPQAAANAFTAAEGVTERSRESTTIGGMSAVRVQASVAQQSGTLAVESTFIAMASHVFVFHALEPEGATQSFASVMRATPNGFRRLTDAASLNVQPVRLSVVATARDATFGEILADYPIPARADTSPDDLALMNAINLNERVPKGTLVKVLR